VATSQRQSSESIERLNLAFSAGAVATSAVVASPLFTASLALGAMLEVVNFRALRRATDLLFAGTLQGARPWTFLFALRFAFLAVVMYVAIEAGAHPIGLLLGLSAIVPASLIVAWRTPPPVLESSVPVPPPDDPSWDAWNPWLARERVVEEEEE
jgi:hypothetical protein